MRTQAAPALALQVLPTAGSVTLLVLTLALLAPALVVHAVALLALALVVHAVTLLALAL